MSRRYGAGPGQLAALLVSFVVTGYAVWQLLDQLPALLRIAIWFVGAAVVWDLLLGPALALVDRLLRSGLPRGALNFVRVPALVSLLLLVVWAPLVLARSAEVYERKTGLTVDPYLERWLAVTAVLFLASALLYGASRLRGRQQG